METERRSGKSEKIFQDGTRGREAKRFRRLQEGAEPQGEPITEGPRRLGVDDDLGVCPGLPSMIVGTRTHTPGRSEESDKEVKQ